MTKKDTTRYLTEQQIKKFDEFLTLKKISRAEVARILAPRTAAAISYYFNRNSWKIEDFKRVKKELENRTREGFELINF